MIQPYIAKLTAFAAVIMLIAGCHTPTLVGLPLRIVFRNPHLEDTLIILPVTDGRNSSSDAEEFSVDDYTMILKSIIDSSRAFGKVMITSHPASDDFQMKTSIEECGERTSPTLATFGTTLGIVGAGGIVYAIAGGILWPVLFGAAAVGALWQDLRNGTEYSHQYHSKVHYSLFAPDRSQLWENTLQQYDTDVYTEAFGRYSQQVGDPQVNSVGYISYGTSWTPHEVSEQQLMRTFAILSNDAFIGMWLSVFNKPSSINSNIKDSK